METAGRTPAETRDAMARITRCRNCRCDLAAGTAVCHSCGRDATRKDRRIFTRQSVSFILVVVGLFTIFDAIHLANRHRNEAIVQRRLDEAWHFVEPVLRGAVSESAVDRLLGGGRRERDDLRRHIAELRRLTAGVPAPDIAFRSTTTESGSGDPDVVTLSFRIRYGTDGGRRCIDGELDVTEGLLGGRRITRLRFRDAVPDDAPASGRAAEQSGAFVDPPRR